MALPLFALTMSACGGDDSSSKTDSSTPADAAVPITGDGSITPDAGDVDGGGNGFPAPPTLGAQIDRFGRPAINTALTDPFWDNGTANAAANHHARQDKYNQASDPSVWSLLTLEPTGGSPLTTIFKGFLAAYDGLDGACGNQVGFGAALGTAYTTLADVLANDQLFLNANVGTCTTFLAVEVAGLANSQAADCGGRTPTYNTIDITYSALAGAPAATAGCLNGTVACGVTNGVTTDPDGAPSTTFPFFNAP